MNMSVRRLATLLESSASNRALKSHSTFLGHLFLVIMLLAIPAALMGQQMPAPDVSQLAISDGQTSTQVTPQLLRSNGEVRVWVQLEDPPLATVQANAKNAGARMSG